MEKDPMLNVHMCATGLNYGQQVNKKMNTAVDFNRHLISAVSVFRRYEGFP